MLNFQPISATEHRERWAAALVKLWDFRGTQTIGVDADRPSLHPEHIFDFHDGLRLLVSRDHYDFGEHIHIGAWISDRSPLFHKVGKKKIDGQRLLDIIGERITFISGLTVQPNHVSQGGVLNYYDPPLPPSPEDEAAVNRWVPQQEPEPASS